MQALKVLTNGCSDCGSLAFTDDQVRVTLRKRQPDDKSIDGMNFGTIKKCVL